MQTDFSEKVVIYTDGACSGNPGPGGWAAVILCCGREEECAGGEESTTNQRMELRAAAEALRRLKQPSTVALYSDSAYLVNAFNANWFARWERNGWRNSRREPVANQDLWRELLALSRIHRVDWHKVKGHSNNYYNERCDLLARREIEKGPPAGQAR